ncbi:MAG: hypothetical protein CVT62_13560 [Actinobacteria bacterium HGW-Actinobacteria-2]|nr:MAG: hypothetical protein CVT62_13560 [Actinobacteria bacterium HGW-Actinobacteria-2]
MVVLMLFTVAVSVVQLSTLGVWARSVRVLTLFQAVGIGFLVVAPLTVGAEWLAARGVAVASQQLLITITNVASWTYDPALEEVFKVAPLVVVALVWRRVARQLGLVDFLLLGAAIGAGFELAEALLRFGQISGVVSIVPGGVLVGGSMMGVSAVPSIATSLGTWLPAPATSDWPHFSNPLHLVWTGLAAAGVGWIVRRQPLRWLGLLPLVVVSLVHANYNARHSISGLGWSTPALTWLEPQLNALLVTFVVCGVAVDRFGLARARCARGEILLGGERPDGLGPLAVARVALRGLPWSTFVTWVVVLERRAALYSELVDGQSPALAHGVEQRIAQLQRSASGARWAEAAKEVLGAVPWKGLWGWRTVVWVLSLVPGLLFLVVGGWPVTRGLQDLASTWVGTGLMLIGLLLGVALVVSQVPGLVRRVWKRAEPSLHEEKLRPGFQLATGVAAIASAGLVVAGLIGGGDPTHRLVTNYHVIDALSSAELWLGLAIILLSFLLFPPAGALLVTSIGTVMITGSGVALAAGTVVGSTLVAHALLSAASGASAGGGAPAAGEAVQRGQPSTPSTSAAVRDTPQVSNSKLQNLINNVYKGTTNPNRVGDGTTMDAIRSELGSGLPTGNRFHTIKGRETLKGLENWVRRNPNAPAADRQVAEGLIDELRAALKGVK